MITYSDTVYDEERALYGVQNARVLDCVFDGPADGESALKETRNLLVERCRFHLRYPFWHCEDASISHCEMTETCRAALWYDHAVTISDSRLHGIKALRECDNVNLQNCDVVSAEFGWRSRNISLKDCRVEGEYPFFECRNLQFEGLTLQGKYSFQYVENAVFSRCELKTKDAFWHTKNVTVTDSLVQGEYLGWYSENLKLVRCHIVGTQPLCYCKNLMLEDCTMEGCDLTFERSEVQATVKGHIDSVKNPVCGFIRAGSIGEIILEESVIDPKRTEILVV